MADTDEAAQHRRLRRAKAVATGFLLLATACFAVTWHWRANTAVGFVNAGAEAGMVGALADWFAVTALFRHPLGLPVPHTAIIPTRKDALGASLERFVGANFLSEPVVRDKLARAEPAYRVGAWLARPVNAARVAAELAVAARGALGVLRDSDVQQVLERSFVRRLGEWSWSGPAGRLLGEVVVDGSHHRLVDLLVAEVDRWLGANREVVLRAVAEQAPAWTPRWVDERVAERVYAEAVRAVGDIRDDPGHRVRLALDHFLLQLAKDLRDDPDTIARAEALQRRLVEHPALRDATAELWAAVKRLVLDAVDDPDSELRRRVGDRVTALGERLVADPGLRARVDRRVVDVATHVVTTYRDELTAVIGETVRRWDAGEAARKLELAVGRDLQFIRVNGTVVGALAGLAIHAGTIAF